MMHVHRSPFALLLVCLLAAGVSASALAAPKPPFG